MATGRIVGEPWTEGGYYCVAVAVDEGEKDAKKKPCYTEYIGHAPLVDGDGKKLTPKELQAACIADVKAQRKAAKPDPLPKFEGAVEV